MSWLLWVVGAVAVSAALVYGVGMALPVEHLARAERAIAAAPDDVAARIRDVRGHAQWRKVGIEIVAEAPGRTSYRETSGDETINFELVEAPDARKFTSTILDKDLPFDGTWTITLSDTEGGTRVAIEERGRVKDALYRFFSRFVFGHTATMEAYLDALAAAS